MKLEMASGHYLNLYDLNGLDLFVIFNEPNDTPTPEELEAIGNLVEEEIDKDPSCSRLAATIEDSGLNCCKCGVQVVINIM